MPASRRMRGFSLLEVMVALAILGAVLVAVLSAQGGLAASNASARNLASATAFGRCKMTEIEEEQFRKGFTLNEEHETDKSCCDDKEDPKFRCAWDIERVELPALPTPDGGTLMGAGGGDAGGGSLSALAGLASGGLDGGIPDMTKILGSTDPNGGQSGGIVQMVMGLVYPSLKPVLEGAIRKVTVKVQWQEASKEKSFELVQYITDVRATGFGAMSDGGTQLLPAGGDAGR